MKTRAIIALSLVVALCGGWYLWQPNTGRPGTGPELDGGGTVPAASSAGRPTPVVRDPGPRLDGRVTPVEAPGCTVEPRYLPRGDGTTFTVYACAGAASAPGHAYETYSNAALAQLAWGDPRAAEVLGMRLRHEDEARAISLVVRASALAGGDPAPLLALSNAWPRPTEIDGVPVRRTVHTKFVLSAVADMLGATDNNLPYWKDMIRRASTDPEREIELLLEQAAGIFEEMRRIELDVTGRSTLGGQGHG